MKEIGSEFWNIPTAEKSTETFSNVTWFVSGRAALRAVLRQASFEHPLVKKKIAIPSYLCESIIQPLIKENFKYSFYSVKVKNGSLFLDFKEVDDCGYILVLNYFGYYLVEPSIPCDKVIIRDLTHSIFSKPNEDADYYFGSLRKWAGFLTGGFAYKKEGEVLEPNQNCNEYLGLRLNAMKKKKAYIEEGIGNKDYLNLYSDAEKLLDECNIEIGSLNDIRSAKSLDIDYIKRNRRKNAKILIDGLKDYCLFKRVADNDCPLCVPILVDNRDKLRKHLTNHDIYCPIHWPKPKEVNVEYSDMLYLKELSLVCDQRYSDDDMKRIVNVVKSFMESDSNA